MSEPLISIVVPIYNVELYLQECLESIIHQTYKKLEIILVDDGSPDGCPQICDSYQQKDQRIKVVHKTNGGLSDARNAGINVATGELISFVDSDDIISRKFIELLYKPFQKSKNVDISICKFKPFYNNKLKHSFTESQSIEVDLDTLLSQNASLNTFLSMECNSACNKLYRRRLFENIKFPKGKIYEDVSTTYKLLFNSNKIYSTQSQLYYYRVRSGSIMGAKSFSLDYLNFVDAIHETIDWLYANGHSRYIKYYYPALLMPEMYAWWGLKNIIKDNTLAKKMLRQYRQDLALTSPIGLFSKRKLFLFKVLGKLPFVYEIYRKIMPDKVGGRNA